jgi:hypothetical protein
VCVTIQLKLPKLDDIAPFFTIVGTHPDMFSNSSASQMAAAAVAAAYPYTFYTAAAASNIYDVGKLLENFFNSLKIKTMYLKMCII